jgi:DNA mismatch repair protein MutS2
VLAGPSTAAEWPRAVVARSTADAAVARPAPRTPTTTARALEINVIGTTAEEACEQVDRFLDRAFLDGRFRIRVIHGFGKGILRKALHSLFAAHPHVEKFYAAPPHEGGAGATVVELKT